MPVITNLKAANRQVSRMLVQLDGEDWTELDSEVVLRNHLAKGKQLSEAECEALLREDAFVRARYIAAGLLQLRFRSTEELRRRLREYRYVPRRRKKRASDSEEVPATRTPSRPPFDEATIEAIITYFAESGRLDDADFARRYIRHNLKVKTVGRLRLRSQLLQFGVDENIVDQALADELAEKSDDQAAMIRRFIERRLPRLRKEEPRRRREKLDMALMRAGFEPDWYRSILREMLKDEDAFEVE